MAVGGEIIEITYNHPTFGAGSFYPKAEEDGTMDLGGFHSSDDDAGITAAGEMIDKITRKRWSFEIMVRSDMNTAQDLEKLNALSGDPLPADWTFAHVNGTVYAGKGKPVGDIKGSTGEATISMKWAGGGVLKKIIG